jgi:hypothetical protein
MTVIAWDGRFVAADSLECYGTVRSSRAVQKLSERNGFVFACTGSGALFEPLINWYVAGCKSDAVPSCGNDGKDTKLVVFRPDRRAFVYSPNMPHAAELFAPDALGCAADMAIGAMEAGASAARAVEISIKRVVYVGGPVQVIDLDELRKANAA